MFDMPDLGNFDETDFWIHHAIHRLVIIRPFPSVIMIDDLIKLTKIMKAYVMLKFFLSKKQAFK